jgi:hypothetical protein
MLIEQGEDTGGAKRAVSGETGMICQTKEGSCVGIRPTFWVDRGIISRQVRKIRTRRLFKDCRTIDLAALSRTTDFSVIKKAGIPPTWG